MAESKEGSQTFDDITKCPMCKEFLSKPTVLPCSHTFCLHCIELYTTGMGGDGKMPCPQCKKEFDFPEGGILDLPRNSFLEKIIEINKMATVKGIKVMCDICSDEVNQSRFKIDIQKIDDQEEISENNDELSKIEKKGTEEESRNLSGEKKEGSVENGKAEDGKVDDGNADTITEEEQKEEEGETREAGKGEENSAEETTEKTPEISAKPVNESKLAKWYCLSCSEHMCDQCHKNHMKMRATKGHEVVAVTDRPQMDDLLKYRTTYCEAHPGKQVDIFCNDCKTPACLLCYVQNHESHNGAAVSIVSEHFRTLLETDISLLDTHIARDFKQLQHQRSEKNGFIERISTIEEKIVKKGEELKQYIDDQVRDLVDEFRYLKTKTLQEMDAYAEEINTQKQQFENFKKILTEMRQKAASTELCCVAEELHGKARDMLEQYREDIASSIHLFFVEVDQNDLLTADRRNIVGEINISKYYTAPGQRRKLKMRSKVLRQSVNGGPGVATLGASMICVARDGKRPSRSRNKVNSVS